VPASGSAACFVVGTLLKTVLATLIAGALAAAGVAGCVVFFGLYDVSATREHTQPVYTLMEQTLRWSVRQRARSIDAPTPSDAALLRGTACYRDHCLQCHGAPGVAPQTLGKSMQPLPGSLADAARRWRARELYWITRHGIRMSGMPAWEVQLSDADLWAVTHFVGQMAELSPAAYQAQAAAARSQQCTERPAETALETSPTVASVHEQGARALRQYACNSCHTIPGLTGSDTQVGPPLAGLAGRSLIAGRLPNTPDNLVRWIRTPHAVKPGTAMPDMGVSETHARQMAAYLATLH